MIQVHEGIFLEEIPLPDNPLKAINNYLVLSKGESLTVDTAFNRPICRDRMEEILRDKAIDLSRHRLFLTHLHSDHTGLAALFADRGTEVLMGKADGDYANRSVNPQGPVWKAVVDEAVREGLAQDRLALEDHPGYAYRPERGFPFTPVEPGEVIPVGDYRFEVVALPGHTPGQMGLYDRDHKILFCGDHILGKITPNIASWGPGFPDPLGVYFDSLRRVYGMDIDLLLSSHRKLVKDHRRRIRTLFHHHDIRLKEALAAVIKEGPVSCRDVVQAMHWDIRSKSWADFPPSQKWFAAGEAHAHLDRLEAMGLVTKEEGEGGVFLYRATISQLPEEALARL